MEKEQRLDQRGLSEEEVRVIDGKKYRRVPSGYTIRQYFSHETSEKGPGPGWDTRWTMLEEYNVDDPSGLPDEPHYFWELIEN